MKNETKQKKKWVRFRFTQEDGSVVTGWATKKFETLEELREHLKGEAQLSSALTNWNHKETL